MSQENVTKCHRILRDTVEQKHIYPAYKVAVTVALNKNEEEGPGYVPSLFMFENLPCRNNR